MGEAYTTGQMASTAMSSIGPITQVQNKEGKRTIVLVGCIVIILLAIVDSVLFYFWLMAPAQARARTAAALRDRTGYDGDDSESGEYPILFDFADPRKVGGRSGAWRLCVTAGCSWLDTYMAAHPVEVSDPCDDFYVHACARHDRSVYEDGRARLMDAMVDALLDRSLVLTTPGDGVVAGAGAARRNVHRGDTREEHLDMLKLCLSGDQPTVSTSDFDSDCENTSLLECPSRAPIALVKASEEFFSRKVNASIRDYAGFVKRATFLRNVGKAKSKPPFGFRDRGLRSSLVSKGWFRRACQWVSLAARCHLPDNLGRSDADLRAYQRAWKALYFAPFLGPQAMHEFTQYMMTEEAPDFEELALPGGISSQDRNDDLQVTLVDSYYGSAKDMDLFASQARLVESNRRRLLLVAPGLLGLLVNVSSSVEPFLVPALAKPLLRAMLADWKPEALSQAAPSARILDKLSRCFTTWINVSEPLSAEVAAEVVILEPLFQLYRKRLAKSVGDDTILHANPTNQQLFFHLWAHGHCGSADGRALVNVVARNSPRFGRAFRCPASKAMAHEDTCSLNNLT